MKILVGLDGSSRSDGVLHAGIAAARAFGGTLQLFRAVGLPPELPRSVTEQGRSLEDVLRDDAGDYLTRMAAQVPPELLAGKCVRLGQPWQALCDEARADDVGLVVIGSHGYGGLDRVLGTTAAKVVNHADRSVLVVRDEHRLAR